jgi:hypothetical protein
MYEVLANPRVQKNSLLLLGAAVAGPALVVAGLRYPGTWKAKTFLALTGVAVSGTAYYYFSSDVRPLLTSKE